MRVVLSRFAVFSLIFISMVGCTTTHKEIIKTGLFDDDPKKLAEAYEKVVVDGMTIIDLKDKGFNLKAPNISKFQGPLALRNMFGDATFQGAIASFISTPEKLKDISQRFAAFRLYIIPYKNLTTEEDRFYINRRESDTEGTDFTIWFLTMQELKDKEMKEVLVYHTMDGGDVKRHSSDSAVLKGILDVLTFSSQTKSSAEELGTKIPK